MIHRNYLEQFFLTVIQSTNNLKKIADGDHLRDKIYFTFTNFQLCY